MRKLAIVTTHPIQYYAPVFKLLAKENISLKVFYTWGNQSVNKYDPDFKRQIEWDIPLLDGYDHVFLENTSVSPGTAAFKGIINPYAIKEIDAFNPDAILVYGWSWQSHLKIIRHYAGKKPVWFRGDSNLVDPQKPLKRIARQFFLRWVYRHIDLAFYVGTHNKAYYKHLGLKEEQLKFAPHAIDNDRFSMDRQAEAQEIRQTLGVSNDGVLILFAGKLEPKKDPLTLLKAFLQIDRDDTYLLFAGNGILQEELKSFSSQSKRHKQVFFLDFQNQQAMPALYQACQIFCLPSAGPGETWGLAVNEAMAASKAVVVSDKVGCAIDIVRDGENGAIFRTADVTGLTQKLNYILEPNERWKVFGDASQNLIQNWSFSAQVFSILEALNKI